MVYYFFKKHVKPCFFILKALKDILKQCKFVNCWICEFTVSGFLMSRTGYSILPKNERKNLTLLLWYLKPNWRHKNLILVFFFSEFQHHKLKKMMLSKSQLTSNVLNSFLPSFKNLTYLDLRSNSLTSFTNTIPQIKTIDIRWASFFANLRFCWISFSMYPTYPRSNPISTKLDLQRQISMKIINYTFLIFI